MLGGDTECPYEPSSAHPQHRVRTSPMLRCPRRHLACGSTSTFLIYDDVYERSKDELSHFTDEESGRFLGESKVACSRWRSKWTNWTLNPDLCPSPLAFPRRCAALPSPFLVACGRCSLFLHCPHVLRLPGGLLYIHQGPGSVPLCSDALLAFVILTTLCAGSVCLCLQLHGEALERGTGLWWWPPWW